MTNPYQLPGSGRVTQARVKWFNTTKGFGFVSPVDGSPDAFLHMAALEAAGLVAPGEGAELVCEIGPGKKGPQVLRVMEMHGGVARPRPRAGTPLHDAAEIEGATAVPCTVRWYCSIRGYGFLARQDGADDVFVSAKVLRQSGLAILEKDQHVIGMVVIAAKGPEARVVRLVEDQA
ncbi:MAG TPA: cold shock domain-containing protein [Alphaproteobacteria bacterium]